MGVRLPIIMKLDMYIPKSKKSCQRLALGIR
jgi:hypothetical protein